MFQAVEVDDPIGLGCNILFDRQVRGKNNKTSEYKISHDRSVVGVLIYEDGGSYTILFMKSLYFLDLDVEVLVLGFFCTPNRWRLGSGDQESV